MNVGENNTVTISVEEYRKLLEIQARNRKRQENEK